MYENLVVKIKLKNLKDVDYWKLSNGSFIVGHYNQRHNGVEYPELFRYMAIDEASVPEFLSDKDQETATIRYELPNTSDDMNAEKTYETSNITMRFPIEVDNDQVDMGKFWLLANSDSTLLTSATKYFRSPTLDASTPRECDIVCHSPIDKIIGFTISSNQPASLEIMYNEHILLHIDEMPINTVNEYKFCRTGETLLDVKLRFKIGRSLVRFNTSPEVSLHDILSIAQYAGVVTFTERSIVIGLGVGFKQLSFLDINPDTSKTMLMNENQEVSSFKAFSNLLKYEPTTPRSILEDFLDNEVIPASIFKNKVTQYSINSADETYTASKTFTAPLKYNISKDSITTLGTSEIPTAYLITKKLREYVLVRTAMSFLRFMGAVDAENNLPSNAEVGDVYQVKSVSSIFAYTANGWLKLSSDQGTNLDFLASLAKENEFLHPTIFKTSILLKELNQNILKANNTSIDIGVPLLSEQEQINIDNKEFLTRGFIENQPQTFTGELTFKETFTPVIEQPPTADDDMATLEYLNNSINAVTVVSGESLIGTTEPNVFDAPEGKLWINYAYDADQNLKPQIWIKTADGWYNLHSQTSLTASSYRIEVDFTRHSSTYYGAVGCRAFRLLIRNDAQTTGYDQVYAQSVTPNPWYRAGDKAEVTWNIGSFTSVCSATLPVGCYANGASYPKSHIFSSSAYGWLSASVSGKVTMKLEFPMLPPTFMGVAYQSRTTNSSPGITGATSVRIYRNGQLVKSQDFPSNRGGNITVTF